MNLVTKIAMVVAVGTCAACLPPAVDPDGTFTIEGALVDADGAPGAGHRVRVVKVDSWQGPERHVLLDYQDVDDFIAAHAEDVFEADADDEGAFSIELRGVDVNNADGSGAAYLSLLYTADDDPDLATVTPWYFFSDQDPVWSAGTLHLWAGVTGSFSADTVSFPKGNPPDGNTWDGTWPTFVLAYTENSASPGDYFLEWGGHFYGSTSVDRLDVPRAAFTGASPPGFVMLARSRDGTRAFDHRTTFQAVTVTGDWNAGPVKGDYLESGAVLLDQAQTPIAATYATDGYLEEPWHEFGPGETAFYVDLGGLVPITDILVYNLVVSPSLSGATVDIDVTEDEDIDDATWINIHSEGPGTYDQQNWLYLGWSGETDARYLRIQIRGAGRTLRSVAEVDVLY